MDEPVTHQPLVSLNQDEGTISFEVETEGLFVIFNIDVDDADCIIHRLQILKEKYYEGKNDHPKRPDAG